MTIKATDLVELFQRALDEKWGYIWGTRGQTWTQANQDASTRDMTVKYGQRWVGRKVADCSGLFVWAFRKLGGDIYHGSNTIWAKYTSLNGRVEGTLSIRPGTAVFMNHTNRRTHIGLYIGGGKCIEAQGTISGVVESDLSRWDEWGQLTDVDYTGIPADEIEVALPILRKGAEGAAVKTLQEMLNADPRYAGLKVDGIFGSGTKAAVRAYQHDHGMDPDGVVGPLTWEALKSNAGIQGVQDDEPEDAPEEVQPDEPDGPSTWDALVQEMREACGQMTELQERMAALIEAADGMHKAGK